MEKQGAIFLVRHGEAEHHVKDFTGGWTDLPLTDKGCRQLEHLARRLAGQLDEKPKILSSDLLRAKQSASILAKKLDAGLELTTFLREKNNGEAAGKSSAEAAGMKLSRQTDEPDNRNYPGGETRREFYGRVAAGMDRQLFSDKPLIIVSHKGTIQNILFWWLGLSIDEVCRLGISFAINAGSLTILRINKWQEHEVTLLNDCAHMDMASCIS